MLPLGKTDARTHKRQMHQHIDLIESNPILHFIFKSLKNSVAVIQIEVNHFPVLPGAVFIHQIKGNVKMADGHNGLNVVFEQLINKVFIKF